MTTTATRSAPSTVTTAFWVWIVVGLALLAVALISAFRPVDVSALPASEQQFASFVPASTAFGGIVGGILHVLFAVFMLRGHNWARVVLTVLGGLTLIGLGINAFGGDWVSAVTLLLTIAGIVLMYLPASNPWFRRR
ncbi:hypothetical protein ABC304_12090 [Microbacterium sp. 1P10UB]|uniref:hypothetical protein n=1 Tax=unclassified Microbacterium TaxID=2609290 RepID=UPI0039A2B697